MCAVWEGIKWLNSAVQCCEWIPSLAMSAGQKQAFTLLNADDKTKAEQDHIKGLHDIPREDSLQHQQTCILWKCQRNWLRSYKAVVGSLLSKFFLLQVYYKFTYMIKQVL